MKSGVQTVLGSSIPGGDAAAAVLAKNWSATALGPVARWPAALRAAVEQCLAYEFACAVVWGPQRNTICNDAYLACCRGRAAETQGSDLATLWRAVWPIIGGAFANAAAGRPGRVSDCAVALPGGEAGREAHLSFSFSPLRGENGTVGGVVQVIEDGTARVLGERRAACLGDLAAAAGQVTSEAAVCALLARQLRPYAADLPVLLLYLAERGGERARLVCRVGGPADGLPESLDLWTESEEAWPVGRVIRDRSAPLVEGALTLPGSGGAGIPATAMFLPLCTRDTQVRGVAVIGLNPRLPLDDAYKGFCERLAAVLSAVLSGALASEEERRQSEELRAVLMGELDHRVRNILASVQSMVTQTGRGRRSPEEYATVLRGRIGAMARAHGLLTRQRWKGADVAAVLHDELAQYGRAVTLTGAQGCMIGPRDAINLTLALHELAGNAASFGALSVPEGRIEVSWAVVKSTQGASVVRVEWQETGGPSVRPVARRGFGSQLIERTLRDVQLSFAPEGVRCVMHIPLKQREAVRRDTLRQEATAAGHRAGAAQPLRGERVLVVEDEPVSALELRSLLEEAGAEVAGTAASLPEAVEMTRGDFSAAVLDLNLQGEMGFPVAEHLLERGVRVLLLTGYDVTGMPAGLRGVPLLRKPVDAAVLVDRLAGLAAPDPQGAPGGRAGDA